MKGLIKIVLVLFLILSPVTVSSKEKTHTPITWEQWNTSLSKLIVEDYEIVSIERDGNWETFYLLKYYNDAPPDFFRCILFENTETGFQSQKCYRLITAP